MLDALRIPARIATIVGMLALVVGLTVLLGQIKIPATTSDIIVEAFSVGLAILQHYAGGLMWLVEYCLVMFGLYIATFAVKYALIFYRFVLKIWE